MNTYAILQTVAAFNSAHDYQLDAVLEFTKMAVRHAHLVQLARKEAADPQLVLPMDLPQNAQP